MYFCCSVGVRSWAANNTNTCLGRGWNMAIPRKQLARASGKTLPFKPTQFKIKLERLQSDTSSSSSWSCTGLGAPAKSGSAFPRTAWSAIATLAKASLEWQRHFGLKRLEQLDHWIGCNLASYANHAYSFGMSWLRHIWKDSATSHACSAFWVWDECEWRRPCSGFRTKQQFHPERCSMVLPHHTLPRAVLRTMPNVAFGVQAQLPWTNYIMAYGSYGPFRIWDMINLSPFRWSII